MLKLEIKLDEEKINREQKYSVVSIYQTLEQVFSKYHLRKERKLDGTVVFLGKRASEGLWSVWQYYYFFKGKRLVHGLCDKVGVV